MTQTADTLVREQIIRLPVLLQDVVKGYWQEFQPHNSMLDGKTAIAQSLARVWAVSEFIARSCLRYPDMLQDLIDSGDLMGAYDDGRIAERLKQVLSEVGDENSLKRSLRRRRRREMIRIAWRDLAGWAPLEETMGDLSQLASASIDQALIWLYQRGLEKDGTPVGQCSGKPVQMTVLGMGKLGGKELNFSSDIDLIFFYPEDGETDKGNGLTNHEFFIRLGRKLTSALNDATEDGFVFRVDMRLRPNGNSGPLVLSFDAAEHYYQTHGREWERYAFIKARAVAGDIPAGEELLNRLRPFVFRRYLDYGAIDAIRFLKTGINQELERKGIENNIKLGPGGIREIEFVGQAFQLVRGGRDPGLQERGIQKVLVYLAETGVLTRQAVTDLTQAYVFLRVAENRLQMIADKQTHVLPEKELDRLRLAVSMGYDDWPAFRLALKRHMQKVHEHFSQVFVAPQGEAGQGIEQGVAAVWMSRLDKEGALAVLEQAGFRSDPMAALNLVRGLREGSHYKTFSAEGRNRMDRLMPLLLAAAGLGAHPETTLSRLVKMLEAIGRRSSYLALMLENPLVLSQLVKLCSASAWIADWIASHPLLLDELLNPVDVFRSHSREQLQAELQKMMARIDASDLERQMETLREFCNRQVLHVAAADIGPGLPASQIGRQLTLIAEVLIDASLTVARQALGQRHGQPECAGANAAPGFIVVAYGKLGSLELGYASDVDIIFLYQSCPNGGGETAGPKKLPNETYFARLGQRLIHILTTRTTGGILYEVDMRLRPSGQSGPLVTSLTAFEEYQHSHAWTWEQQALVRARPIVGDAGLIQEFARVRQDILCQSRDLLKLAQEVVEMRDKMMSAQDPHDPVLFDLKHDRGGIVDIEFMVQYWVLRWAHDHPVLTQYTDNAAILEALATAGLLEKSQVELLISAYHQYLSTAYRLKLMQDGSLTDPAALAGFPEKVAALWFETFPGSHKSAGEST